MIRPGLDIHAYAKRHKVRFVRKDASWFMRLLGWLFKLVGYDFMARAWTTIGRTIYYPTGGPSRDPLPWTEWCSYLERHRGIVEHELHHVQQYRRLWHLHSLFYLFGPLPVLLSFYRADAEIEPYAHECAFYGRDQEATVNTLWKVYGWPLPKSWLRERLARAVRVRRLLGRDYGEVV